jgi:uncharacterized membrane protein
MERAVYIVLCLVAPVVWGVVSSLVFDYFERRQSGQGTARAERPAGSWDMYEI